MVEISTERRKRTEPAQVAGESRKSRRSRSGRTRNKPGSAGTRVSLSSAAHAGWVKSPVPSTRRPLRSAHQDRCSMSQSLLHARENFEWICRSAWNMSVRYCHAPPSAAPVDGPCHPAPPDLAGWLLNRSRPRRVVGDSSRNAAERGEDVRVGGRHRQDGIGSWAQLWLPLAGAALLAGSASIHLDLYLTGYRSIPTIGWLFLVQFIAAFVLAATALGAGSR